MCFCSVNDTNGGSIDGKLNLLCSLLCLFYTFWVYFSAAGTSQVTQVWWRLLIWYLSSLSVVSIGMKTDPPPTTTNVHRSSSSQNPAEVQGDFQTVWIKVSCHTQKHAISLDEFGKNQRNMAPIFTSYTITLNTGQCHLYTFPTFQIKAQPAQKWWFHNITCRNPHVTNNEASARWILLRILPKIPKCLDGSTEGYAAPWLLVTKTVW